MLSSWPWCCSWSLFLSWDHGPPANHLILGFHHSVNFQKHPFSFTLISQLSLQWNLTLNIFLKKIIKFSLSKSLFLFPSHPLRCPSFRRRRGRRSRRSSRRNRSTRRCTGSRSWCRGLENSKKMKYFYIKKLAFRDVIFWKFFFGAICTQRQVEHGKYSSSTAVLSNLSTYCLHTSPNMNLKCDALYWNIKLNELYMGGIQALSPSDPPLPASQASA